MNETVTVAEIEPVGGGNKDGAALAKGDLAIASAEWQCNERPVLSSNRTFLRGTIEPRDYTKCLPSCKRQQFGLLGIGMYCIMAVDLPSLSVVCLPHHILACSISPLGSGIGRHKQKTWQMRRKWSYDTYFPCCCLRSCFR